MILPPEVAAPASFAVVAWGVKASFCGYIARLSDGVCDISAGVRLLGGGLYGMPGELTSEGSDFTWQSQEWIRFSGHGGALEVLVLAPSLQIGGSTGSLCVAPPGGDGAPLAIAAIGVVELTQDHAILRPQLNELGVALFGGNYPVGTALDDMRVIFRPEVLGSPIQQTEGR